MSRLLACLKRGLIDSDLATSIDGNTPSMSVRVCGLLGTKRIPAAATTAFEETDELSRRSKYGVPSTLPDVIDSPPSPTPGQRAVLTTQASQSPAAESERYLITPLGVQVEKLLRGLPDDEAAQLLGYIPQDLMQKRRTAIVAELERQNKLAAQIWISKQNGGGDTESLILKLLEHDNQSLGRADIVRKLAATNAAADVAIALRSLVRDGRITTRRNWKNGASGTTLYQLAR
jgi:hypothetical protein